MDSKLPGFGLRVNPTGYTAYIFRYRFGSKQHIYTISHVSALTASQARDKAKQLAADIVHNKNPATQKEELRNTPLFRDVADQYIKTSTKRTIKNDQQKLKLLILPMLGAKPVNSITKPDILKLMKALSNKGRKPATINRYRSLLSVIFNFAIDSGYITENPAQKTKPLPENNERVRWLTDIEQERVIQALQDEPQNARNAIMVCLVTGRRRGDVFNMKWEDINYDHRFWHIPRAKDNKKHNVPLTQPLINILKEQEKIRVALNPYVFPGRHGRDHIKSVQRSWKAVSEKAELEDFHLHDLRHNYASQLVQNNIDLYVVGTLLGHSDSKMTRRYAHLADDNLSKAANIIADQIDTKPTRNNNQ